MTVEYHYKKFPPQMSLDEEMRKLVNEARTELGRYDGFLSAMSNSKILLSPLFTQEAVLSSKIEGTQSTLTEVLEFKGRGEKQEGLSEEKKNDLKEVLNYRYALNKAINLLKKIPLGQRLLKETHKELMKGTRGHNKSPGEFRKIPVWIGPDKSDEKTASFNPIKANKINTAMANFEKFLHNNDKYDDLIKVAILHVEFEAIHPFLDGNGRLGRMMISLYLNVKKIISTPSFYISNYFEKNREDYYNLLREVSEKDNWLFWCKFFVKGIIEQARDNFNRAKKIQKYYNNLKEQIPKITKSQYGITALDYIFSNNYFDSVNFYKKSKISKPTATRLLSIFEKEKILNCVHGLGRKPNFYVFKKLIDIADGR